LKPPRLGMVRRVCDVLDPLARARPALSSVCFIGLDSSSQKVVRWAFECSQSDQSPSPDRVLCAAESRAKHPARRWLIRHHVADDLKDKVVAVETAEPGARRPRTSPCARYAAKSLNTGSHHPPLLSGRRSTMRAFKSVFHSRFDFRQRRAALAEGRCD
jgi:hypothetical protein